MLISIRPKTLVVLRRAFINSLPVLMGYLSMGFAAGVLLSAGSGLTHPVFWAWLTSTTSISGALQFMLVGWIHNSTPLRDVAMLTFCLNVRYAMYGLSLIERFRGIGLLRKLYLIWAMTDETYALEVENAVPPGGNSILYCLTIAALDHAYWIAGVVAGATAGAGLPFPNRGIDFAMTALFLVILTDQCRERVNRLPAFIGCGTALASFLVFGADKMLIPAILLMMCVFLIFRSTLEPRFRQEART